VVTGKTLKTALLAMVEARETIAARHSAMEADHRNEKADLLPTPEPVEP
jgi:hypothetical protein